MYADVLLKVCGSIRFAVSAPENIIILFAFPKIIGTERNVVLIEKKIFIIKLCIISPIYYFIKNYNKNLFLLSL